MRHTLAAQPDLGARLGAGLDLDLLLAVRRWDGQSGAQCGLRHRQWQFVEQLGVLSPQLRVWLQVHYDVQIAGHPTARRGLALARQADLVALVDARWHDDAQRAPALNAAVAVAGVAG